jgi:hypothetical protein
MRSTGEKKGGGVGGKDAGAGRDGLCGLGHLGLDLSVLKHCLDDQIGIREVCVVARGVYEGERCRLLVFCGSPA